MDNLEHISFTHKYIRINRKLTGSWITVKLPKPMTDGAIDEYMGISFVGWEVVCYTDFDPDEVGSWDWVKSL